MSEQLGDAVVDLAREVDGKLETRAGGGFRGENAWIFRISLGFVQTWKGGDVMLEATGDGAGEKSESSQAGMGLGRGRHWRVVRATGGAGAGVTCPRCSTEVHLRMEGYHPGIGVLKLHEPRGVHLLAYVYLG